MAVSGSGFRVPRFPFPVYRLPGADASPAGRRRWVCSAPLQRGRLVLAPAAPLKRGTTSPTATAGDRNSTPEPETPMPTVLLSSPPQSPTDDLRRLLTDA